MADTNAPAAKEKLLAAYKDLAAAYQRASEATTAFVNLVGDASTGEIFQVLGAVPVGLPTFGAQPPAVKKGKSSKTDDEEGGKKKKPKKVKDPNAPKRPPSAYIEFQNEVRNRFRDGEPDLPYAEILRRISVAWSALDDAEKKIYQDRVAENRVKYEADRAVYEQEHPNAAAELASPDVSMGDILVDGESKVGKDGKEYTGKKRGRKSKAEKAALAASAIDPIQVAQMAVQQQAAQPVATAGIPATPTAATETKEKKKKDKTPKVPVKPPTPVVESSEEDESSEDEDSDDDSSDDSDESEDEPAPPPAPVASSSKSNGKSKRTAEVEKSEKKKKKKTE